MPSAPAAIETPPVAIARAPISAGPVITVNGPVPVGPAEDPGAAGREVSEADPGDIGGAVDGSRLRWRLRANQRWRVGSRRLRGLLCGRIGRDRQSPRPRQKNGN